MVFCHLKDLFQIFISMKKLIMKEFNYIPCSLVV